MNRKDIPWLVLLIGCGFLSLMGWSLYRASQETSGVTDRDYYSHGLRYNETLLEQKAAEALGWRMTSGLKDRTLQIMLRDSQDQPVTGARGRFRAYDVTQSVTIDRLVQELGQGQYKVDLPAALQGTVNVRLTFERDGARINRQLLLNI
ncbi:MAG: FixH family protein [Desulfuromonadales bacterium]